ncbi:16S rRNA (cytidine(1402)-2'-O)-methyltransferase [Patescibacteria group bacterium]|nr:16S rRNA (cytidine(1402)-2'-O)-methyltransferase [Patescibacteria group bacterium]
MSTLFVVATPIGNLEDITLRALRILKEADFVLAEDTRNTVKLLNHFEIKKKLISFHEHTRDHKLERLANKVSESSSVALVSDAGTPLISDPGKRLLAELYQKEVEIIPIPGPSAVTAALSVAPFPADRFEFRGFIPHKKRKETILKEIAESKITTVFFESPYRIIKTLDRLSGFCDEDRQVFVAREITKKFEEYMVGSISEVSKRLKNKDKIKGELTVVVAPK